MQAVERGNKECPICLTLLEEESLVAELSLAANVTSGTADDDDPKLKQQQHDAKPTTAKSFTHIKPNHHGNTSRAKTPTISSIRAKNSSSGHSNSAKQRNVPGAEEQGNLKDFQ